MGEQIKVTLPGAIHADSAIPIRFFIWDDDAAVDIYGNVTDNESEFDGYGGIIECDESAFLAALSAEHGNGPYRVFYNRHTIQENGVSQICLTASPEF